MIMAVLPAKVGNLIGSGHYRLAVFLVLISSTINSIGGLLVRSLRLENSWTLMALKALANSRNPVTSACLKA